jgi:hypothetical protein
MSASLEPQAKRFVITHQATRLNSTRWRHLKLKVQPVPHIGNSRPRRLFVPPSELANPIDFALLEPPILLEPPQPITALEPAPLLALLTDFPELPEYQRQQNLLRRILSAVTKPFRHHSSDGGV